MTFNPNNYFDIWNIFTYEIVGDVNLVMALGLILLAYYSAKYAIPFQTGIALMILWIAVFALLTANIGLYTLVVFVVAVLFYWVISRIIRRN